VGSQEFVVAFDTNTGKQLWKMPSGRAFNESRVTVRGTPTVDGKRLYALAARHALCLDFATGERVTRQ
jgi:outer membrane protein assembly factor BamB